MAVLTSGVGGAVEGDAELYVADRIHRGAQRPGLRRPDGDDLVGPAGEAFQDLVILVVVSGSGVAAVDLGSR